MDIIDFNFPDTDIVFFLYEPLWDMKKKKALKIYNHVFDKLTKSINNLYIIYITGSTTNHLNKTFFSRYNLKPLKSISFGALVFPRCITLLKHQI